MTNLTRIGRTTAICMAIVILSMLASALVGCATNESRPRDIQEDPDARSLASDWA